jgi:hypothetical protein
MSFTATVENDTIKLPLGVHLPDGTAVIILPRETAGESARQPTGFVRKWGGSARKIEAPDDAWLSHLNDKHLR